MPRCHIYHKPTGTLLARDLYEHRFPWLLDLEDGHELLPESAFLVLKKSLHLTCYGEKKRSLLLPWESLLPLPRGPSCGCCGPMGEQKNVLAADEETPIAWETADCHTPCFIRVDLDEWELEKVSDDDGACWVAWIKWEGKPQMLRAAYGLDAEEARTRLLAAAQARLDNESRRGSQTQELLKATIEMQSAEDFAHLMRFAPTASEAKLTWLQRKYSTA